MYIAFLCLSDEKGRDFVLDEGGNGAWYADTEVP